MTQRTRGTPQRRPAPARRRWLPFVAVAAVVLVVAVLYAVFRSSSPQAGGSAGSDRFQVGSPGAGQVAPAFSLPAAEGGVRSLADYRGKTVLLYFHEGLGCQPCWDQVRDLGTDAPALHADGVDEVVPITTGAPALLAQKMRDDHLPGVALSDQDLAVSRAYNANQYGMMGNGRDGHTFVLVGPDGKIQWRADYGGAPNYTMYVPPAQLVSDLQNGRRP